MWWLKGNKANPGSCNLTENVDKAQILKSIEEKKG